MSTLALKYRPLLLKDLIGQEMSVGALTNILTRAKRRVLSTKLIYLRA